MIRSRFSVMACSMFLVTSVVLGAWGCAGINPSKDSATHLEETVKRYTRTVQEKKWRLASENWHPEVKAEFLEWSIGIPEHTTFASVNIDDVVHVLPRTMISGEKAEKRAMVYISVEYFDKAGLTLHRESWIDEWQYFNNDDHEGWLICKETRKKR